MDAGKQYLEVVCEGHMDPGSEAATSPIVNVYHYKRTSGLLTASKTVFRTKFLTEVLDPLKACLSVKYITDRIRIRVLDDATDPYLDAALAKDGTVVGDSHPATSCAMVDLKTGRRGRFARGRKFYGPIAESDTTLNSLTSGALALWATACTAIVGPFTDANGEEWRLVVVDRKASNLVIPAATVVAYDVTEAAVKPAMTTLKRRKRLP